MKCERCDNPAIIHVTEMAEGIPRERHFCEKHAAHSLADECLHRLPFFLFAEMEEETLKRFLTAFEEADVFRVVGTRFECVSLEVSLEDLRTYYGRWVRAVIKLLKDEACRVRYYGAVWLGQMGADANEAIPHLRGLAGRRKRARPPCRRGRPGKNREITLSSGQAVQVSGQRTCQEPFASGVL